eukprot:ANDGO_02974.mRNA.1 hypothetical protein
MPRPEVFDIPIPRSANVPPVAQRLASATSPQRDSEFYEERFERALNNRASRLSRISQRNQSHITHAKEIAGRVNNLRDEEHKSYEQDLKDKLDRADERRSELLNQKSTHAHEQVARVKRIAKEVRQKRASGSPEERIDPVM